MNIPPNLTLVEFHDGLARQLIFDEHRTALLRIDSLNCYFPKANNPSVFEIWCYRALLTFRDFTEVTASFDAGTMADALNIYDAEFSYTTDDAQQHHNLVLLTGKQIVSATIDFRDGGHLKFVGGLVKLELIERLEYLEDFHERRFSQESDGSGL